MWKPGYVALARDRLEMSAFPRGMFEQERKEAASGKWRLADASGRSFRILDFVRTAPFGGLKAIPYLLLLSVFSRPSLAEPTQHDLEGFKGLLVDAIRDRYRYVRDAEFSARDEVVAAIRRAERFEDAIGAIPQRLG
jgi:hypothetical protein